MEPFFQVGVIVENIEAAMDELTRAQNIVWGKVINREYRQWRFRRVFSLDGPPYIELVEGPPGSPWDSSKGSRLDHLQWWTRDMAGDTKRMLAAGLQVDSVKEEELIAPDARKPADLLPRPSQRHAHLFRCALHTEVPLSCLTYLQGEPDEAERQGCDHYRCGLRDG